MMHYILLLLLLIPSLAFSQALDRTHVAYHNPLVNGATCDDVTLNAAITAIGSNRVTLIVTRTDRAKVNCTWTLAANVTFPSNITAYIPTGVVVSVNSTFTVIFNGASLVDDPVNSLIGLGSFSFIGKNWQSHPAYVDLFNNFTPTGGLHNPTSANLISSAFATTAWINGAFLNQASVTITYPAASADVCWTIISSSPNAIPLWTQESTTFYHMLCEGDTTPNQPVLPADSVFLMGPVTITAGAIAATLDKRILSAHPSAGHVDVTQVYGVIGDGVADNQTSITTAILNDASLYFPDGVYKHSGTINWRRTGGGVDVRTESKRNVVFSHTGAGPAHQCNGGTIAASIDNYNLQFGPARITGNAATTIGFSMINCHEWDINIQVNKISGIGFKTDFAIGGTLRFNTTPNGGLQSVPLPAGPTLNAGILIDGNTRVMSGTINDGTDCTTAPAGTVLNVISFGADSAPIIVGMPVRGVIINTSIVSDDGGGGGTGLYSVADSQDFGACETAFNDGGITGPTNNVYIPHPIVVATTGVGIEIDDANLNIIVDPIVESNTLNQVQTSAKSTGNKFIGLNSNGDILDRGIENVWDKISNGGTMFFTGATRPRVFGGRSTFVTIDNTTAGAVFRGFSFKTTFTDSSTDGDIQVVDTAGVHRGWSPPYPSISVARVISKLQNNDEERTTTGAFLSSTRALRLNDNSTPIVATWPGSVVAGQIASIINTSASGTAAHSVELAAGVTFDGTNDKVTLNAPDEAIFIIATSSTRWHVIAQVGTPVFSP